MRPVHRKPSPKASWSTYNEARPALESTLGDYCSYCEMIRADDVEHKLSKHVHTGRERNWDNFLLACKSCNGIKRHAQNDGSASDPDVALSFYLWPDTDNTTRAFVYHEHSNDVSVDPRLPPAIAKIAADTIRLTGIDRIPGKVVPPTAKDKRWKKRRFAWEQARQCFNDLLTENTEIVRRRIAEQAAATGFWSVWRVVFANDADMLGRLDGAFVGTANDCFDAATRQPIPRPNGRL